MNYVGSQASEGKQSREPPSVRPGSPGHAFRALKTIQNFRNQSLPGYLEKSG